MNTPILIITFNRPDFLKRIISVLKKIRPKKIYFKIDGPRENNKKDLVEIQKVFKEIKSINWNCKKFILKSKKNLGSRDNPIKGINWLFRNETKGIILEDDCIPSESFFRFCEELLIKYKNNKKISMISGRNNLGITESRFSYYFTYGNTWGWATWRRAWRLNDVKLKNWSNKKNIKNLKNNLKNYPIFFDLITDRCKKILENKINSAWDYQWFFSVISNNMIGIIPKLNLIKNIGFDDRSSHKTDKKILFQINSYNLKFPLKHNNKLTIDKKLLLKEYNKIYKKPIFANVKKFIYQILKKNIK